MEWDGLWLLSKSDCSSVILWKEYKKINKNETSVFDPVVKMARGSDSRPCFNLNANILHLLPCILIILNSSRAWPVHRRPCSRPLHLIPPILSVSLHLCQGSDAIDAHHRPGRYFTRPECSTSPGRAESRTPPRQHTLVSKRVRKPSTSESGAAASLGG